MVVRDVDPKKKDSHKFRKLRQVVPSSSPILDDVTTKRNGTEVIVSIK